uniref:Uncharacterized protein n=1 Tax=Cacopsylla melanoneura TaxID=428564 RepID=A0A8D9AE80_9HEMI
MILMPDSWIPPCSPNPMIIPVNVVLLSKCLNENFLARTKLSLNLFSSELTYVSSLPRYQMTHWRACSCLFILSKHTGDSGRKKKQHRNKTDTLRHIQLRARKLTNEPITYTNRTPILANSMYKLASFPLRCISEISPMYIGVLDATAEFENPPRNLAIMNTVWFSVLNMRM